MKKFPNPNSPKIVLDRHFNEEKLEPLGCQNHNQVKFFKIIFMKDILTTSNITLHLPKKYGIKSYNIELEKNSQMQKQEKE